MPTPDRLHDLRATPGSPASETFVFCTACHKIIVRVEVKFDASEPVVITFRAEPRPGSESQRRCRCEQVGWVQLVEEGTVWAFDNSSEPWRRMIGEELPSSTPSHVDSPTEEDPNHQEERRIWYGEKPDDPQDEIRDTPGVGQARIEGGENDGARVKRFATRYVCRNRSKDGRWEEGTHDFELRWSVYLHDADAWAKVAFGGNRPTELQDVGDPCP